MAAIPKPGIGPYGLVIVLGTCTVGFILGGTLDHWITGSDRNFGAFGAAFGLSIGGLVAASLVEFFLPFLLAALALNTGSPAPTIAASAAGEERISFAGRIIQTGVALLALLLGAMLIGWGLKPLAGHLAIPHAVAGALLGVMALSLGGLGALGGAALARHLDLTVE